MTSDDPWFEVRRSKASAGLLGRVASMDDVDVVPVGRDDDSSSAMTLSICSPTIVHKSVSCSASIRKHVVVKESAKLELTHIEVWSAVSEVSWAESLRTALLNHILTLNPSFGSNFSRNVFEKYRNIAKIDLTCSTGSNWVVSWKKLSQLVLAS